MNKIITAGCMAIATFAAVAVPTKTELERAKPVVEDMTKADLAAYKAGEKTAQKVAAAHIAYAQKAEGEAAKYLLLQGAFKLYARSGEYDLAAEAISIMKRDIKDLPLEVIVEIVSDELRYVSDDKASRLVAMLQEVKGKARPQPRGSLLARRKDMEDTTHLQATVNGYTWSYRVDDGEATIEAKKDGKFVCAVSPNPTRDVTIPSMLNGVKVTSIGQEAFCHYCGPKSVKIPEGVKSIGWCAFFRCTNLTAVTLPKSLKDIGHGAFADCSGLTAVAIPEGVTNIEDDAFRFCRGLKSVTLPSSVTNICGQPFVDCSSLKSIRVAKGNRFYKCENGLLMSLDGSLVCGFNATGDVEIPEGITTIRDKAFCNCGSWVKSVTFPSSIRNLGMWTFANCGGIKSVVLPEGVTAIGEGVFYSTGIKTLTVPASVKSIGGQAFARCYDLESVTLPSGVTNIVPSAFGVGGRLNSFCVDSANPRYSSRNGMLCSKDGVTLVIGVNGDVTIPACVASIGPESFGALDGLKRLTIPSSVTNVCERAFNYADCNCGNLTSVTMLGERPACPDGTFNKCPNLTEIHVPANAKSWAGMKEWQGKKLVFDAKAE